METIGKGWTRKELTLKKNLITDSISIVFQKNQFSEMQAVAKYLIIKHWPHCNIPIVFLFSPSARISCFVVSNIWFVSVFVNSATLGHS